MPTHQQHQRSDSQNAPSKSTMRSHENDRAGKLASRTDPHEGGQAMQGPSGRGRDESGHDQGRRDRSRNG
jgi:hypothetical protein